MTDTAFLSDEEIKRLTLDQQRSYLEDDDAAKRYWTSEYRKKWERGESTDSRPTGYVTFGWIMLLAGLAIMLWGLSYDPSVQIEVPSISGYTTRTETVVNIGEAAKKIMIFAGGGFSFLCGCIFLVGADILRQIPAPRKQA